ncbi:hypothetical protein, unlikely [Trypanosoma brucei gambiense DAL972]|uniref:Uncharacterized protein n=1 Tax=Trypanosoma brucei gambiense (strain MHOM/CI/86/DAL972) TaxID=679716 RepID=C9ZSK7_TRYB9|nr:hypothetical protein, unlikely [Trypanosoma brucei gambiense DAL972]CBH12391.1 hypothetical protein, unlikely [Trypanosoma brucei gambiense DAL972]|eukprot:XP_011774672.1 hypothetical protein, unlikely [Trypanosoma brucei gambiense DAL972]
MKGMPCSFFPSLFHLSPIINSLLSHNSSTRHIVPQNLKKKLPRDFTTHTRSIHKYVIFFYATTTCFTLVSPCPVCAHYYFHVHPLKLLSKKKKKKHKNRLPITRHPHGKSTARG